MGMLAVVLRFINQDEWFDELIAAFTMAVQTKACKISYRESVP